MNACELRLCCGFAAIAGEPPCACDRREVIDVGMFSPVADQDEWWSTRMRQRQPRDRRAIESLLTDHPRARRTLARHAYHHGRSMLWRKVGRVPMWWQWTSALNVAMVAELMADIVIARGGLLRAWP